MRNLSKLSWRLVAAGLLAVAGLAHAQTQIETTTFQVLMEVEGTCNAPTTSDINFGTLLSAPGTQDQFSSIKVQCTKDLQFLVSLDEGLHAVDGVRAMKRNGAGDLVHYTLSHEGPGGASCGTVEQDSAVGGNGSGMGVGTFVLMPLYARATLTGDEPAGSYSDRVTVTLSF